MGWSAGAGGVALILFAWTPELALALPLLFISGLGMMLTAASTNTVLQSIVPDELRGRVAALYVMSFLGMSPLGSLFSGWVAQALGGQEALTLCAGIGLCASLVFAYHFGRIRQQLLPLYKTLNIPRQDR
jgi:MFS family permease